MKHHFIEPKSPRIGLRIEAALFALCLLIFIAFRTNFNVMFAAGLGIAVLGVRRLWLMNMTWVRVILIFGAVVAAGSFAVIETMVIRGQTSDADPVPEADVVVILGAGLDGTRVKQTLRDRLDASVDYLNRHPGIPVIVSGGQGPGESITEAEAMMKYLTDKGIPGSRIHMEQQSTSTEENLIFSRRIMSSEGITHPRIVIITSDFHMFRSKAIAKSQGYEAYGFASPSPAPMKPMNLIREYFAVIKALL